MELLSGSRSGNTGRPAGPLFLHLPLRGQIDATGWAIVVTGWAFAHPVGTLEKALACAEAFPSVYFIIFLIYFLNMFSVPPNKVSEIRGEKKNRGS